MTADDETPRLKPELVSPIPSTAISTHSASRTSSGRTAVLGTLADRCAVYRSIHSAIDITAAYELGAD
jgi:hypothetical protein